ncbi:CBS domain-containing protein CBSX6-like [Populus alba x Populus x berolinensis]|nr:CBS domain-containing protein CBSX6-like [Populus alba x Populus x berolinensis]
MIETSEMRQQRFVGILNSLDIVAFLASTECLEDQDKAIKTSVSQVVVPNASLLKQVDPATRCIGNDEARCKAPSLFQKAWYGKWLKNADASNNSSNNNLTINTNRPSSSSGTSNHNKFCCLSREDVIRFLIGCLGALAPLPLSSISSLGIINPNYMSVEASLPAFEATRKLPVDPSEVAVVEPIPDGQCKIIGEISASRLWKCDYLAAAWALANLSAGQFVMGVEDNEAARSLLDFAVNSAVGDESTANGIGSTRLRKFSSRSIGFNPGSSIRMGRSMYRVEVHP